MNCKNCGHEIDKKAVICTQCGCKVKKPFYKKWWIWVIVVIVAVLIMNSPEDDKSTTNTETPVVQNQEEEIVFEPVDLQALFDELKSNAMKAENNYKNKYIEFECKIENFDSDGTYVSVEPTSADEWNFSFAMCYIKDDTQKEFLLQKNVGDTIKIRGKVKSIGEVLGYHIDIKEVF